jgi:hypothetical protein
VLHALLACWPPPHCKYQQERAADVRPVGSVFVGDPTPWHALFGHSQVALTMQPRAQLDAETEFSVQQAADTRPGIG